MPAFDSMDHETSAEDLHALRVLAAEANLHWQNTVGTEGSLCEAVEVGTWAGRTALAIEEFIECVYCVDHWQGNPNDRLGEVAARIGSPAAFVTFCRNMGDLLYRSVIPCRGKSLVYADIWPRKVAMVFIDANHEYPQVSLDIIMWQRHVIQGGILCGHDYGAFEGVTRAVNELIPKDELHLVGNSIWYTYAR